MSVLYIGNYGDVNSGWAIAAQNNIRALKSAGVDVVARRVQYTQQIVPSDLLELEVTKDVDTVIQHVLPHNLSYNGNFRNIAYFVYETSSLGVTGWGQYLEMMDEVWVPSEFVKSTISHLDIPLIRIVPHALDPKPIFNAPSFNLKEQTGYNFLFYTVADFNRRKNLAVLIRAIEEFPEDVGLVIKTNAPEDQVRKFSEDIKKGLKKPHREDIIITGLLPQEQIYAIHKSCDVFVMPSRGEGWCLPVHEALCAGRTPIVTGWSSLRELVSEDEGWRVAYSLEPCFGAQTLDNLNTAYESWAEIDYTDLVKCMWESMIPNKEKELNCMKKSMEFTHEKVGKIMRGYLDTPA